MEPPLTNERPAQACAQLGAERTPLKQWQRQEVVPRSKEWQRGAAGSTKKVVRLSLNHNNDCSPTAHTRVWPHPCVQPHARTHMQPHPVAQQCTHKDACSLICSSTGRRRRAEESAPSDERQWAAVAKAEALSESFASVFAGGRASRACRDPEALGVGERSAFRPTVTAEEV